MVWDRTRKLYPPRRCGNAVSVAPTRVAAPWKCSSNTCPIGVGQCAKHSIIVSMASSLKLREKARFPVIQRTFWITGVQHAVELAIRHRTERIDDRRTEPLDRLHRRLTFGYWATVAGDHGRQFGARAVRSVDQCRGYRVLIGDRRGEIPIKPQHFAGTIERVGDQTAGNRRAQPETAGTRRMSPRRNCRRRRARPRTGPGSPRRSLAEPAPPP